MHLAPFSILKVGLILTLPSDMTDHTVYQSASCLMLEPSRQAHPFTNCGNVRGWVFRVPALLRWCCPGFDKHPRVGGACGEFVSLHWIK